MKYQLRTFLIVAAIAPTLLAWAWLNRQFTIPLGIWLAVLCLVIWQAERLAAKRRA